MATIMRNNHVEFGDLNFLNLLGITMGTSSACIWVRGSITPLMRPRHSSLPLNADQKDGKMIRLIDDIFGIWVCDLFKRIYCIHWTKFVASLPFGKLTWTTNKPSKSVVFLDMRITILNGRSLL